MDESIFDQDSDEISSENTTKSQESYISEPNSVSDPNSSDEEVLSTVRTLDRCSS